MIIIENDHLYVAIHPKGAELQELRNKHTGINHLWSGDPNYWGKFSPILFPIVGTLKDNTYMYNGYEYTLPRHGFARDRTFIAEQLSPVAATFTLKDDAETRINYPFPFKLEVHYQLDDDQLTCRYTVSNTGESDLLFSLGAHPAFAVPMEMEGMSAGYEDHFLVFDRSSQLLRYKLNHGLISETTAVVELEQGRLPLSSSLFNADALVMKGLPDTEIRIESNMHTHGLSFRWEGFPFFGIWAAPGAHFVCLEPWCGIADSVSHNKELAEKEGVERLPPGDMWTRHWIVKPF